MIPRLRVEALLVAARRVFGHGRAPALVEALSAETGLHPNNVLWALDHALELSPTEAELDAFVRRAPARTAALVVLSANVFVAPLRAIAWALAQSERVLVRTSRRASTFTRALLEAAPALLIELVESTDDPAADIEAALSPLPAGSAVHVYGAERAIETVAALARRHAVFAELHGPGFGAIVDHAAAIAAHVDDIARDVIAFDQGGCLSPRVVVAIVDPNLSIAALGEALDAALARLGADTPRRTLDPSESAACNRTRDAAIYAGRAFEGSEHLLVELPEPALVPAARVLTVTGVRDLDEAITKTRALGRQLASVGTSSPEIAAAFADVRVAPLGFMQRPPLDGPVDRRVDASADDLAGRDAEPGSAGRTD